MPAPVTLATWASDTNYPAGAQPEAGTPTKVALTTGQATIGWRPDQIPTAQELNYWMNVVGLWIDYLDALTFDGDVTITGNLTVTGNTALGDNIADTTAVSGPLTVGDTLDVTGNAVVGGTLDVTGVATFVDDVSLYADKNITLLGTGKIKSPERVYLTVHFDAYDYLAGGAAGHVDEVSGLSLTNGAADTFFRLPAIPTEYRVKKIEIEVDGANTGSMTLMTADNSDGTYTPVTGATSIAVSGGLHTLTPTTPSAGTVFRLRATPPASGTAMILRAAHVYVDSI